MESAAAAASRDPAKQARIEATLDRLRQVSKSYGNVEERLRSGVYRTDRSIRNRNRAFIEKTKARLTRKLNRGASGQVKGDKAKIEKLGTLLSVMENDTNVENSGNYENGARLEALSENSEGDMNSNSNFYVTNSNEAVEAPVTAPAVAPAGVVTERKFVPRTAAQAKPNGVPDVTEAESVVESEPPSENNSSNNDDEATNTNTNISSDTSANSNSESNTTPNTESNNTSAESNNNSEGNSSSPLVEENALEEPYKQPVELDETYQIEQDNNRYDTLKGDIIKCRERCAALDKELNAYNEILEKKKIEGITLDVNETLIDLLVKRILLDSSDHWKEKLDTLVLIPNSLTGSYLRGGDYFEALFQLAIILGILPEFKGKFVRMYDINRYKTLAPLENYLYEKTILNSGGKKDVQGVSDITFEVASSPEFKVTTSGYKCGEKPQVTNSSVPLYFISVKGFKKEKSVKNDYDIPLLDSQISIFPERSNKHIVVCVRNKEQFMARLSRTQIEFLKQKINKVFGYDDIINAFTQFRIDFFNKFQDERTEPKLRAAVEQLFPRTQIQKPILSLYFHQELVAKSVAKRIVEVDSRDRPHFLCIGVLPRGGKSFIAGGVIDILKKRKGEGGKFNVLFLTSAINETREQFKQDLIEKFSEFDKFKFIDVVSGDKALGQNNFFFVSRQLSTLSSIIDEQEGEEGPVKDHSVDLIRKLKSNFPDLPPIDICFFDEAHIGITSINVRENFQKTFEEYKIPIILMTATYKNPAKVLESESDLFVWDLNDIVEMKTKFANMKLEEFISIGPDVLQRYPSIAEELLTRRIENGETEAQIAKPYVNFPNPNFISLTFKRETIDMLNANGDGFSYKKFFEYRQDTAGILKDPANFAQWHSLLTNEQSKHLREFMTPDLDADDKILIGKDRAYRALNQVFSIAQKQGSRPFQSSPFSILMFLPFNFDMADGRKARIGELCRIWASFMLQRKYWRDNFVFLTLSTYSNHQSVPVTIEEAVKKGICHREDHKGLALKSLILEVEREALKEGKGLVILSGDVAKMGISLPCVDVVFLMTNTNDADDLIQKMYRALTDDPPLKKNGFVVDLNIKRIISAFFDYDLEKDRLRISTTRLPDTEERFTKMFELCNWGQDALIQDPDVINISDVMTQIKERVTKDLVDKRMFAYKQGGETKLLTTQISEIKRDPQLLRQMIEAIGRTAPPKKGARKPKGAATTLAQAGVNVPNKQADGVPKDDNKNEAAENDNETPTTTSPMLSQGEIEQKASNILKTFVNTLVIRSVEPWTKNMNLVNLLKKFKEDAESALEEISCVCSSNGDCTKEHNNLYELVFCELKNYAMIQKGKSFIYSSEFHEGIMRFVTDAFKRSSLIVEWNIYIENLIRDLQVRSVVRSGGRWSIKTRKIKRTTL